MAPCGVALEFGLVEGFCKDGVPIGFGVEVGKGVDRNHESGLDEENCDSRSARDKQSTCLEPHACAWDDLSRVRNTNKCASVSRSVHSTRLSFFTSPSRARHSPMSEGDISLKKNVQDSCKRSDGLKRDGSLFFFLKKVERMM